MPAARVVQLSTRQKERLQSLLRAPGTSPQEALRATVLLLSDAGHGAEDIALTLGVTRRTVTNARSRWQAEGLRGLRDRSRSGRPRLADDSYRALLRRTVERDPREFGYAFTRWTAPRLASHLAEQTGVSLSSARVASLLRQQDFVWRRTRHTLRNLQDEQAIAHAQHALRRFKKGLCATAPASSCGSATA